MSGVDEGGKGRQGLARVGIGSLVDGVSDVVAAGVALSIDTSQSLRASHTTGIIALFVGSFAAVMIARTVGAAIAATGTQRLAAVATEHLGLVRALAVVAWLRIALPISAAVLARFVYRHGGPIGPAVSIAAVVSDIAVLTVAFLVAAELRLLPWASGRIVLVLASVAAASPGVASLLAGSSSGAATGATALLHGAVMIFVGVMLRRYARA